MPPAARITDMHVCPMVTGIVPHVGGPILPPGVPQVLIGFLPAATVTNMCTCVGPPDIIVKGSSGVFINFLPAARMGDTTAHGGTIILGEPTVMIGETGGGGGGGGGAAAVAAGVAASGASNPDPSDSTSGNASAYSAAGSGTSAPGSQASQAPNNQTGYPTQDAAAKAALDDANPQSIQANREYGGAIYQDPATGNYHYTGPTQGSDQGFDPASAPAPAGTTAVGDYHTHGDYSTVGPNGEAVRTSDPARDSFNSDNFSGADINGITHDGQGNPAYKGYLGTPSGQYKTFQPSTGTRGTL